MRRLTPVAVIIVVLAAFAVLTASAAAWTTPPTQLSYTGTVNPTGGLSVALSPNGTAIETWVDQSMDVWASTRAPGDASAWTTHANLSGGVDNVGCYAYDRDTAINDAGVAATVWINGCNDPEVLMSAFRSAGGTWTTQAISGDPNVRKPKLGLASSGAATAAWFANDQGVVVDRPAGGSWGTPVVFGNPTADANIRVNAVQLAVNARGDAVVAWTEADISGSASPPNDRSVYVLTRPAGGTWDPVDKHLITTAGQTQSGYVAIDAAGDVVVMYETRDTSDVMVATKTVGGAWATPTLVAPGTASDPSLAISATGELVVGWSDGTVTPAVINVNFGDMTGTWSGATTVASFSGAASLGNGPFMTISDAGVATALWNWTADNLAPETVYRATVRSLRDDGATLFDARDITPVDACWTADSFTGNGRGDLLAGVYICNPVADLYTAFASVGRADGSPVPSAATLSVTKAKVVKKKASFSTTVTVSGAGKVVQRATFTMKVKGKKRTIVACTLTRTTTKAGAVRLSCKLSAKARKALKRGKLKLAVTTTFTPTGGTAIVKKQTLVFKQAKAKMKR